MVYIHLGNAQTGEVDRLGPYDFAQLTYTALRVEYQEQGIEDFTLATFSDRDSMWLFDDGSLWTDLTISEQP